MRKEDCFATSVSRLKYQHIVLSIDIHTWMLHNNIYMSMVYNQCGVKNRHYFFHSFFICEELIHHACQALKWAEKKILYRKKRNLLIYFCVLYGSLALSKMAAPRSKRSKQHLVYGFEGPDDVDTNGNNFMLFASLLQLTFFISVVVNTENTKQANKRTSSIRVFPRPSQIKRKQLVLASH